MELVKMKNTISEMVNTPDGIFNRLDTVEKNDWICGPTIETVQNVLHREQRPEKNGENNSDIWEHIKQSAYV